MSKHEDIGKKKYKIRNRQPTSQSPITKVFRAASRLEVLGLKEIPDSETLKKAHRRTVMQVHPDRHGNSKSAEKATVLVNLVRQSLADPAGDRYAEQKLNERFALLASKREDYRAQRRAKNTAMVEKIKRDIKIKQMDDKSRRLMLAAIQQEQLVARRAQQEIEAAKVLEAKRSNIASKAEGILEAPDEQMRGVACGRLWKGLAHEPELWAVVVPAVVLAAIQFDTDRKVQHLFKLMLSEAPATAFEGAGGAAIQAVANSLSLTADSQSDAVGVEAARARNAALLEALLRQRPALSVYAADGVISAIQRYDEDKAVRRLFTTLLEVAPPGAIYSRSLVLQSLAMSLAAPRGSRFNENKSERARRHRAAIVGALLDARPEVVLAVSGFVQEAARVHSGNEALKQLVAKVQAISGNTRRPVMHGRKGAERRSTHG